MPDLGCYLIDFISLISKGSALKSVQQIESQTTTSFGVILKLENEIIAEIRSDQ